MTRIGRRRWFAAVAIFGALFVLPSVVYAQSYSLPGDPLSTMTSEFGKWTLTAQSWAKTIYLWLVIFEFFALALTTLLFRENLGEFFASIGLKVFLSGLFLYLIGIGPTLAQAVVGFFSGLGENSFDGGSPTAVVGKILLAANMFFVSAIEARAQTVASTSPLVCATTAVGGVCPLGLIDMSASQHSTFILIAQGIGLMMVMAAIGILLQFYIVTIESFFVMSVGILMVGFAGSRWTFGFSQGYFSYMINVGVKLMVTYIILGIAGTSLVPILAGAAVQLALVAASVYGIEDAAVIGVSAITGFYVILVLGLVWTIPSFVAGILSGQSQSSGSAILSQAVGSFAGAAQAFAQFGAAGRSAADAASNRSTLGNIEQAHASGAGGATNAGGLASQTMARGQSVDAQMAPAVAGPGGATAGIGVGMAAGDGPSLYGGGGGPQQQTFGVGSGGTIPFQPINPQNGMPLELGSGGSGGGDRGRTLYGMKAEQVAKMDSGQFRDAFRNTDFSLLSQPLQQSIIDHHSADAESVLREKAAGDDQQADFNRAYGLGALASTAPREIGQPSAVQVRTSNPDRL